MKKCYKILAGVLMALALCGCGVKETSESVDVVVIQEAVPVVEEEVKVEAEEPEETTAVEEDEEMSEEASEAETVSEKIMTETEKVFSEKNGYLVVIDAGHQQKGNSEKEPIGPGASEVKAKVSSGTTGVATGLPEYQLNLKVALLLEEILIERGYDVLQVRTTHEVNISNSERAAVANEAGADAFIRIHANGSENASVNGVMTLCQTPSNPYNGQMYGESRRLSDCVLDAFVEKTGTKKQRVWETDTMSGINWAMVPTTIVEMGYMSNAEEDQRMADEGYQKLMAEGMADGIDRYFGR